MRPAAYGFSGNLCSRKPVFSSSSRRTCFDLRNLAFGSDVIVVLEVVRQLLDLHLLEAGFFEHLFGLLLAPHRAQALAALSKRDSHAVHARDGVEERAYGV